MFLLYETVNESTPVKMKKGGWLLAQISVGCMFLASEWNFLKDVWRCGVIFSYFLSLINMLYMITMHLYHK